VLSTVCIIPAHNESPRIGTVLRAALGARMLSRILVVDDGSTDGTADTARAYGVEVLSLQPNRGKGRAMVEACARTQEPVVLFLDADLLGLTHEYIDQLVIPVATGQVVMTLGMNDYGRWWTPFQAVLPAITGQRAVRRDVLQKVPASFWSGYRIEVGINEAARRTGPVRRIVLSGVSIVPKWGKITPAEGLAKDARMMREVLIALAESQQMP